MDQLDVPGVPFPLVPTPADLWRLDQRTGVVTATAAARTDIFVDPGGATVDPDSGVTLNAATLLGVPPQGDFQLSARVTVDFAATFDAGVLMLWADDRHWGKLCFEFSPAGDPMIVSVVCRGVADDANAFVVPGRSVWLRVSRVDRAYAYHASVDGRTWQLIRFFALDAGTAGDGTAGEGTAADGTAGDRVGFEAQSPTGDGCTVTFDEIRFVPARLAGLRDGS